MSLLSTLVQDLPAVCFVVPVQIMRTWILGKSEDGSGVKQVVQVWNSFGSPRGLRRTQGALVASILLWVVADHYSKKRNQYTVEASLDRSQQLFLRCPKLYRLHRIKTTWTRINRGVSALSLPAKAAREDPETIRHQSIRTLFRKWTRSPRISNAIANHKPLSNESR